MTIPALFHNAIIDSIASYSKEKSINIYDLIRELIENLTEIISGQGQPFPGDLGIILRKHLKGQCSVFGWGDDHIASKRKPCTDFLIKVDTFLKKNKEQLGDTTWCDMLTYLMFLQSNCHHGDNIISSRIYDFHDSFLNFFYISKNGLDLYTVGMRPFTDEAWIKERWRESTEKEEHLGEWWTKAYEKDKYDLLMFHDLAYPPKKRTTIGWTIHSDYIPGGHVINILRNYHGLPSLSGDYGIGMIQGEKNYKRDIKKETYSDSINEAALGPCGLVSISIGTFLGVVFAYIAQRPMK